MRNLFSKFAIGSMIAGAALLVSACGQSESTANTTDTNMTDLNTVDSSEGMTNDASALDATANDANVVVDNASSNEAAPANAM